MSNLITAIERESINSFKLIKSKKEIIGISVIVTNADNLLNFVFQNVRDEDTGVLSYIKSINLVLSNHFNCICKIQSNVLSSGNYDLRMSMYPPKR